MSRFRVAPPPEKDLAQVESQWPELGKWLRLLVNKLKPEAWREIDDAAGKNPTFDNSWDNVGTPYANAAFYKDLFGVVRLQGRIDTGATGTVAFTLPAGYRPSDELAFTVHNTAGGPGPGGASVWVKVEANGDVTPNYSAGADVGLDQISFRVAQ